VLPGSAEIERLLAQYIGPVAKIIAGRARRSATDDEGFVQALANAIDGEVDRAAFLAAAQRLCR
jgi:hypothetical protein